MDSIKATPRNEALGRLADLLTRGKTAANQYQILPQVPLIGGTGLGDLFMGKAPELLDDVSYDGLQAAIRGGNLATGGIGTYGARPAVADAALLGMDVAGLGKGLGGLSKKSASVLYDKLMEGGTSLSRRDALKKLGAISGSTALAGTGVGALRSLSDNVVSDLTHAAPKIADNVAATAAKNYKFNSLADYFAYIRNQAAEEGNISFYEHGASDMGRDAWDEIFYDPENPTGFDYYTKRQLRAEADWYGKHKADVAAGREPTPWSIEHNPQTNQFESVFADEVLSPQAKQEMREYKAYVANKNAERGWETSLQRKLNPNGSGRQLDWTNPTLLENYLNLPSTIEPPF